MPFQRLTRRLCKEWSLGNSWSNKCRDVMGKWTIFASPAAIFTSKPRRSGYIRAPFPDWVTSSDKGKVLRKPGSR